MSALPRGWVDAEVREVVQPTENCDPTKEVDLAFRYVDIGSINNKTFSIENPKTILGRDAPSRAKRRIRSGDVLFSTVRTYLKNIALVPDELDGEITSTGIAVLRPSHAVLSDFLFALVRSEGFIRPLSLKQDGTLYPAITDGDLLNHRIPVPPLAEQKRIVAKLDALNAKSARARTELARIDTLVSRYKQAMLSKAFIGELTREWRTQSSSSRITVSELQSARQQLVNARGIKSKNIWELSADFRADLPEVPDSWAWVALGEVAVHRSGIAFESCDFRSSGAVQVLRLGNFYQGNFHIDRDPVFLESLDKYSNAFILDAGSIIVSLTGTKYKKDYGHFVKVCAEFPQKLVLNQRLLELTATSVAVPNFIALASKTSVFRDFFFSRETGGVNQGNVGIEGVMGGPIPLPPRAEQYEIVHRIESAFAKIDRLAKEAKRALDLVGRLDEAILAKAFRGELVPQDEKDEPADHLVARIRAEREAAPKGKRGRGAKG